MKILICQGTIFRDYSFSGGSELSFEYLSTYLAKKHEVHVVTQSESKLGKTVRKGGLFISYVNDDSISKFLKKELVENKYDWVFTQLIWSEYVVSICKQFSVPCAYFIRSIGGNIDYDSPNVLVANSVFIQKKVANVCGRKPILLYPCIDMSRVMVRKPQKKKYICMFNPIAAKGGYIFKKIALAMPNRLFVAVNGWGMLRSNGLIGWNKKIMKQMSRCHGENEIFIPEDVDMHNVKNIKLVGPVSNPSDIFSKMQILLVPSIWEEAFGRVVIEALVNGIPVIASNNAGIREACRFSASGCKLIDNFEDASMWISAINGVLLSNDFNRMSKSVSEVIFKYNTDRFIEIFLSQLIRYK